jgi:hypothetical protein
MHRHTFLLVLLILTAFKSVELTVTSSTYIRLSSIQLLYHSPVRLTRERRSVCRAESKPRTSTMAEKVLPITIRPRRMTGDFTAQKVSIFVPVVLLTGCLSVGPTRESGWSTP